MDPQPGLVDPHGEPSSGRPHRAVSRRRLQRGLALVALASGALVSWRVYAGEEGFSLDPEALRARIAALGWMAPAGFVAAATLRPFLMLPSWALMSAGGLLFGIIGGTLYGIAGFAGNALLVFGIARGLGREALEQRLRGGVALVDDWVRRRGASWIALYTALPITPLTAGHGAAGLSGMGLGAFGLAAVAGLVPRTLLYSFFGDSLAEGDWTRLGIASAVLAVAALAGLAVWRRLRHLPRDAGTVS